MTALATLRFRVLDTGCWQWLGGLTPDGYGRAWDPATAQMTVAHRLAYETLTGSTVPDRMVLDHLCRTAACVNPAHLEAVTQAENLRRGTDARYAGRCHRGHPWPESAVETSSGRKCSVCQKINQREWYLRQRARHQRELVVR